MSSSVIWVSTFPLHCFSLKLSVKSCEVILAFPFSTQPVPLFAEESDDDEEAEKEPEWKKRKIWGASTAAHFVWNSRRSGLVFVYMYHRHPEVSGSIPKHRVTVRNCCEASVMSRHVTLCPPSRNVCIFMGVLLCSGVAHGCAFVFFGVQE